MTRLVPKKKRSLLIAALLAGSVTLAALLFGGCRASRLFEAAPAASSSSTRLQDFPPVILWAWERPVALDFIDTREVGVAYLARTIYLRGGKVVKRPRLQPLSVPQGTTLIAVARIESDRGEPPQLSSEQSNETAAEIASLAQQPGVSAIQVDFDAKLSERDFYRALLSELRQRLPAQFPLSITALASWCAYDNWLDELPVDEAVPMLFRMGVDQRGIFSYLATGTPFRSALCRGSLGVSLDEKPPKLPRVRRLYVFSTEAWTPDYVRQILVRSKYEHPDP